jgi:thiol-disulfide isomerase/thioredoxin
MSIRKLAAVLIAFLVPAFSPAAEASELHSFVSGSFREIRAAHAGVPTIVHFWGLSCGPCLVELPEWGRLLRERPDLNLVMVHADRLPNDERLLTGAISRAGLGGSENWAFEDGSSERLFFEVDPKWRGEIPMTLLIAPDGTSKRILGSADMTEIRGWLDAHPAHPAEQKQLPNINAFNGAPAKIGAKRNVSGIF